MILERAELPVRAGEGARFEAAFAEAKPLIAAAPGFHSIALRRPITPDEPYLLLVEWDSVAHHRDGFRQSPDYARWSALLHSFYDPMPVIGYFAEDIACST
jgi:heme-degrading monooxygenase HmoA